jgi:hypothetical protein
VKTQSEVSEEAWRLAAELLVDGCELRDGWSKEETRALEHIRRVIIPSLNRKAKIVERNRRKLSGPQRYP